MITIDRLIPWETREEKNFRERMEVAKRQLAQKSMQYSDNEEVRQGEKDGHN